jgi:putative transposase
MSAPEFLFQQHRKSVRHFDLPGDAHFLTFSCFRRLALLSKDRTRKWFIESLEDARDKHRFQLWAWVIMSEHVHLLIFPTAGSPKIKSILADIKRPVGQRAIAYLVERRLSFVDRLTIRNRNRTYRRFWQAGPGQDHNVYDPETAHRVVEYIHDNPVRRGLVMKPEDWYWSSARDWCGEIDIPIKVDRTLPAIVEVPSCG